ncbi:hypothetical protein Ahy_B01g052646 [Arachis hypogaea]|uniref:Uncharacterized protein n=1 Tax=Arachis hypogaea TaxID=3818 RepID=A0A445AQ03_ARAHY|nr:hypothetical protein Ahy_B01g052646 [Arachis hypogaea]
MATIKEKAQYNKTHYCRCQTKAIATVYKEMGQEKRDIVEAMGFGGLEHVPELNVSNTLLIELSDQFDIERGCLKIKQGTINITLRKVAAALGITNGENLFLEKVDYNKLNPTDKEIFDNVKNISLATLAKNVLDMSVEGEENQKNSRGLLLSSYKSTSCSPQRTEQEKDNAAEKRKQALEIIREKRSKKRNDGAQSINIAPDQFDSPQGQNDFSQTSVQEELMKDDFMYVPPQEETQQTSNNDPAKEQEQQAQEPPVQQESEQEAPANVPLEHPCEEPTEQQSKQEATVDVCPPEPNKQGVTGSITSSVIEQFFKDADVYQVTDEEQSKELPVAWQSEKETLILSSFDSAAKPREREYERPSFSLGISPPASQPTQVSQESDSQLDILAEAVIDARVEAALKYAEGTSSEPTLLAAQVYRTPQKKTKITNELIEKCYHWMTHVKQIKDSTNEYEQLFVLKHEGHYEGLREYFTSLKSEEQVHAMDFWQGLILPPISGGPQVNNCLAL